MFILFGLGNNKQKYLKTKHNAGRIIIENLAKSWNLGFRKQKNFHWIKAEKLTKIPHNQTKIQDLKWQKIQLNQTLLAFDSDFKNVKITNPNHKNNTNNLNSSVNLKMSKDVLQEFYLVYSDGFMNNSGEILRDFCNYYKLSQKNSQIVVLQDDSDQLIGNCKLSLGGGTAGHNGIISVYKHFDKEKIWRLKIGIRPVNNNLKSETFVLSAIEGSEEENLVKISSKVSENLAFFEDFNKLQNLINSL
jgi:peptidyl-tRNA hydrolase